MSQNLKIISTFILGALFSFVGLCTVIAPFFLPPIDFKFSWLHHNFIIFIGILFLMLGIYFFVLSWNFSHHKADSK
ncbi:MAG: hypothetical protein M9962_05760 [Oligoflexia bacterium]|nr:hypothetical protein [Oligoflexia bacterium]